MITEGTGVGAGGGTTENTFQYNAVTAYNR
jgi:hypothetical protein